MTSSWVPSSPARRLAGWALAAAAVLALSGGLPARAVASGMLELAEIVSHPEQYDRQMVTVTGRVSKLRAASNRQGRHVYGFLLRDGESMVRVLGTGRVSIRDGEYVVVEGVFHRLRKAGRSTVYNQIKASLVRSLDRLHPDLVG